MTWTIQPRSNFGARPAIQAGEGACVVLLHGVGLRAEAWAPVISGLSQGHHVIAPDMPGHGASTDTLPTDLAGYATAARAVLTEPAVLVGHSMGAMIALALAAEAPDLVRGVVAVNAIFERDAEAAAAVQGRAAALDGQTMADPSATLTRWFGQDPSPERAACEAYLRDVDPAGYKAAYTVFANEDGPSRAALAGLACPALFLTGAGDPNSTPAMSRAMAELAPRGAAQVYHDAAHMLPMTHAARLTQDLTQFIHHSQGGL